MKRLFVSTVSKNGFLWLSSMSWPQFYMDKPQNMLESLKIIPVLLNIRFFTILFYLTLFLYFPLLWWISVSIGRISFLNTAVSFYLFWGRVVHICKMESITAFLLNIINRVVCSIHFFLNCTCNIYEYISFLLSSILMDFFAWHVAWRPPWVKRVKGDFER